MLCKALAWTHSSQPIAPMPMDYELGTIDYTCVILACGHLQPCIWINVMDHNHVIPSVVTHGHMNPMQTNVMGHLHTVYSRLEWVVCSCPYANTCHTFQEMHKRLRCSTCAHEVRKTITLTKHFCYPNIFKTIFGIYVNEVFSSLSMLFPSVHLFKLHYD
jgi:hypothetical protein